MNSPKYPMSKIPNVQNNPLRVVFFGTPLFVEPVLEALENKYEVVGVVTAPDRKVGRKQEITPSPIKIAYTSYIHNPENDLRVFTPEKLDENFIEEIKKLNPDLFVVAAYGQILPKKLLDIPLLGTLNVHPSLLPKYRGPTPVQTAILNGEAKTGISFIKLDEQVDHGPILFQKEIEIEPNETSETLLKKIFIEGAKNLIEIIEAYSKNEIKLCPQDDSKATYTKILTREDGFIDISKLKFKDSLEIGNWKLEIARRIRAYYPWPGVWTKIDNKILKLFPSGVVQLEGKNPVSIDTFKKGYPDYEKEIEKLGLD